MSKLTPPAAASSGPQETTGAAKGLVKGLALVDLIAESPHPLRQVDLAEASGFPRPTVVRLLDVLCELHVLSANRDGSYGLGPRLAAWGTTFLNRLDLERVAADVTGRLVDLRGETVFLGILDRGTLLYVSATHSPHPVRPASHSGMRNPLHSTGMGKVLLASLDEDAALALLEFPLERRTPNTIVERPALLTELQRIRERGYAIDEVENEDGIRCVAAAIRDHTGEVVAALSISAPSYRFSEEDAPAAAGDAREAAIEISRRLGYQSDLDLPPRRCDGAAE